MSDIHASQEKNRINKRIGIMVEGGKKRFIYQKKFYLFLIVDLLFTFIV